MDMISNLQESTFVFEVYIDNDYTFPQTMSLPGFYLESDGAGYAIFRPKVTTNGEVSMNTNQCDFCETLNENGPIATMTKGEWVKVEQRVKINDQNESNGEFIMYWNGVEVIRQSGLADMVPVDGGFYIAAARYWTMNNSPATESASKIFNRQVTVKKFLSDSVPHATTTPATTTYPVTTTPSKF